MKRILYILLMLSAILTACDKLPANGDLDGMWQVMEVEHGGTRTDMRQKQLYMSIQLKMFQLNRYADPHPYYGYFERSGNTMRFWQFSYGSKNETQSDDNVPIGDDEVSLLHPWGFYSLNETFTIDELTKDNLVLRNDSAVIKYRKF